MWRSDGGITNALPPYRGHGPQAYGPTDGRLPQHMAPRQQTIASIHHRNLTNRAYKEKSHKITVKKLWIVFSTLVVIVGFICVYFGLRAANGASSVAQDHTTSAPVDEATTASTVSEATTVTQAIESVVYELNATFESGMKDPQNPAFTLLQTDACLEWEAAYSAAGQAAASCQLLSASAGSVVLELMLTFTLTSVGVTPTRLMVATQVFAEQTASFREASRCLDANIIQESAVSLNSDNGLCDRNPECDNYHVCTPSGTSGVTCSCWEGYTEVAGYGCVVDCVLANCLKCASTTSCMTCKDGYDLTNEGTCQAKCEVDNCASCVNPDVCDSCILHYALNTSGEAPVCNLNCTLANCMNCASPTSCMLCDTSYELSNGGSCQAKCEVDNCASCVDPNVCDSCILHYALNTSGESPVCNLNCTLANCITCASPTSCMTCDTSYELSNGGSCQAKCEVDNCASCVDPNVCDSCSLHYALNTSGESPVCNLNCTLANCMTCASPTSCMTCDTSYELSNGGSCQAKCEVDNCASCVDPNVCDSCILHYALNTSGESPVCNLNCTLANCMTCASPTACMTCDTSYELSNGGSCQAKCDVDNCASCMDPNVCDSCILHYALNTTGEYPVCNLNCTLSNCTTCASPTSCMTCDWGFELSNGGSCQAQCEVDNCASCSVPNVCDLCLTNYTIDTSGTSTLCKPLCHSWCTAGCLAPNYCMECPFSYRVDPDMPGNCLSDCPFDNAIDTSEHQSVADRTTAIRMSVEGNGPTGMILADDGPIEILGDGLIKFNVWRGGPVVTPFDVYMYVNEKLHLTSGLFKYRQYTDTDITELAVAKGYVCNHKEVFELDVDCSACMFDPVWMLHLKIEDVPIADLYSSTVLGTLNCEVIVTSDGNENYAAGYFTSEPYGNNGDVEISEKNHQSCEENKLSGVLNPFGWVFSVAIDYAYGPFTDKLRKNHFVLNSNVGIPGVWVYKLPTPPPMMSN